MVPSLRHSRSSLKDLSLLAVLSTVLLADAAFFKPSQDILLESCKDYAILAGDTMDADCTSYCGANATETFDYADPEEDPDYVVRNSVCRCFSSEEPMENATEDGLTSGSGRKIFECWSKAEVWDKATPIFKCGEKYNVTSLTTCQEFCKPIDPVAFTFSGNAGNARCACAEMEVCSDLQ